MNERAGTDRFQAIIATKWYWPPAAGTAVRRSSPQTQVVLPVGYADSISARPAAKHRLQIPAVTRPHITEVGPPAGKARDKEADSAVQEFRMAKARPSMLLHAHQVSLGKIPPGQWPHRVEKFRLSSALWPSAANWALSSTTESFRMAAIP